MIKQANPWQALKSRNLRIYFTGYIISNVGSLMAQTTRSWLVYSLTGSAVWLGVIMFVDQFSTFVLLPFAGVFTDRWNRHRSMLSIQTLLMLVSLTTAILVLTNRVQAWHLLILTFCQGCINAFDITNRQAFVAQLAEKPEHIGQVVSINTSIICVARMLAPAMAGLIIAYSGAYVCFLTDTITFIAVLGGLLAIKLPKQQQQLKKPQPFRQGLQEGFSYVTGKLLIKMIVLLIAIAGLFGVSLISTLLPVFATDILEGDSTTLGFLFAASGMGSLLSAVYTTTQTSIMRLSYLVALSPFLYGTAMAVFAISQTYWVNLIAMFVIGFGFLLQHTTGNALIQILVPERIRGRVSSLYIMAFNGMGTIGSLIAGILSSHIGPVKTVFIGGLFCLGTAVWFASRLSALQQQIKQVTINN